MADWCLAELVHQTATTPDDDDDELSRHRFTTFDKSVDLKSIL
jgi:hypothetical protein